MPGTSPHRDGIRDPGAIAPHSGDGAGVSMSLLLSLLCVATASDVWKAGDVVEGTPSGGLYSYQEVIADVLDDGSGPLLYNVPPFGYATQADIETEGMYRILPAFYPNSTFPGFGTTETAPDYVHVRLVTFSVEVTGLSLFTSAVVGSVEDQPCGAASPTYSPVWTASTDLTDILARHFSGALTVPAGCRYKLAAVRGSPTVTLWNLSDL